MSRITVTVEGGLLPDDLLERIADGSAPGQRAADFGLAYWAAFRRDHEGLFGCAILLDCLQASPRTRVEERPRIGHYDHS